MNLKPKALTCKKNLLRCSQEQNTRFSLDLNRTIWRVKSSCDESGVSAIGLVIVTFFVFLLILLPMNLFVQELNLYRIVNHKAQIATEMASFDAMLRLDANAMSEEKLIMNAQLIEWFEADLIYHLTVGNGTDFESFAIENLAVSLLTDHHRLSVKYDYIYETRFVLKGHLTKKVDVELNYELPLNN